MNQPRDAVDLTGRSILIVEDAFYLAIEMEETVARVGGTVVGPFADASEGLAALARRAPDAAVVDINLGAGPSFQMADALQEAEVPFVFLTGYDASVVPERFANAARVQKPANTGVLLRQLAEVMVR